MEIRNFMALKNGELALGALQSGKFGFWDPKTEYPIVEP